MLDSLLCNPHISDYICSLEPDLPTVLAEIERVAIETEVPIIRKEAQGLLRFLLKTKKPKRILEIGAAVGFSACFQFCCTEGSSDIITIEKVPDRICAAKKNISEFLDDYRSSHSGMKGSISLVEGDAAEVLDRMVNAEECFDVVFLDAAKAQYPVYLPKIMALLPVGGMLITDNVLQEGSVAESKFTVTRRDRTIHLRMREYIDALFHDECLASVILPLGDGMTVTTKLF